VRAEGIVLLPCVCCAWTAVVAVFGVIWLLEHWSGASGLVSDWLLYP
jgi:hypothetical protein